MLKNKIERLMTDFGVKQEKIIEVLGTNRVTFGKKLKDNSFTPDDCHRLNVKFGKILN
jgi:DNA-binding protein Fis